MHVRGTFRSQRGSAMSIHCEELPLALWVQTSVALPTERPDLPLVIATTKTAPQIPRYPQGLAWGWRGEAEVRERASGARIHRSEGAWEGLGRRNSCVEMFLETRKETFWVFWFF